MSTAQTKHYGPTINGVPIDDLVRQRDALIVEFLALRASIHDLGVQDADDSWYAAVARADAFMDALIAKARLIPMNTPQRWRMSSTGLDPHPNGEWVRHDDVIISLPDGEGHGKA